MNNVKVVQYGCGKMSVYTMRYVMEKGGIIVGAIDFNPNLIGEDISKIIGCQETGITITSLESAEEMLKRVRPDICIITTMSLISDCKDAFMLCAKLGINAISTCEEAFYPFNSSPAITEEIDLMAKQNNCTITASGYQDAFWGNLITTLAGTSEKITKIKGVSSYNVEDYGIALAKVHGAGLSLKEFEEQIASVDNITEEQRNELIKKGEFLPSYMWNVNGWLCDKLGLTILSQTQKCVPQTHNEDLVSSTLNMKVPKGNATGMSAVVVTETKEGITFETECIGKIYSNQDYDCNNWTIFGVPETNLIINRPATVELTCATIVNRIPDVIKSEPGFVPTSRMDELKFIK